MANSSPYDYSIPEAIGAAKKDVELATEIMSSVEDDKRKLLRELAGPHLAEMLENRGMAEAYLKSGDPNLRSAALMVMADHWGNPPDFAELCERIALEEQNTQVGVLAMTILCECLEGSKDMRVARLLASLVCDESKSSDLRA